MEWNSPAKIPGPLKRMRFCNTTIVIVLCGSFPNCCKRAILRIGQALVGLSSAQRIEPNPVRALADWNGIDGNARRSALDPRSSCMNLLFRAFRAKPAISGGIEPPVVGIRSIPRHLHQPLDRQSTGNRFLDQNGQTRGEFESARRKLPSQSTRF